MAKEEARADSEACKVEVPIHSEEAWEVPPVDSAETGVVLVLVEGIPVAETVVTEAIANTRQF